MEVKDGIYSRLTVFYYCKSISTSQSVCNQLIKKCLVQLKCTFWFETSVCLKIYICKNKKKGIIKYISYSFFVSTNNHFIFFPVYFFDQPEAQWEVFLQLSNKEGARIKRGGGCLQSHSRSRGSLLLGFWHWRVFEVFWILLTRWS